MPERKGPKKSFIEGLRLAASLLHLHLLHLYYIYIYTTSFLIASRESIDNSNIMSKMQMQQKHFGRDYDERMFKEAATRKIRTFKYDPTKPVEIKFKDTKSAK